jgi:DNA-binding response OmpR family regulator
MPKILVANQQTYDNNGRRRWDMPEKCRRILLIGGSCDDPWRQVIEGAVASLGTLQIAREVDALSLTRQQDYDLIVIDAATVADVFLLIPCIRAQKPDARIVVATASPTWMRARKAFRAGATDYIRKSLNKEEVLSALRATVNKAPPIWRR